MPVIPNLADSRAESRVNGNQVKAFPALTGKRLTAQTRETMTCINEGPNLKWVCLSPLYTAAIAFPEQVKPLVLTHFIT